MGGLDICEQAAESRSATKGLCNITSGRARDGADEAEHVALRRAIGETSQRGQRNNRHPTRKPHPQKASSLNGFVDFFGKWSINTQFT